MTVQVAPNWNKLTLDQSAAVSYKHTHHDLDCLSDSGMFTGCSCKPEGSNINTSLINRQRYQQFPAPTLNEQLANGNAVKWEVVHHGLQ